MPSVCICWADRNTSDAAWAAGVNATDNSPSKENIRVMVNSKLREA
jgi:hypothetical protein